MQFNLGSISQLQVEHTQQGINTKALPMLISGGLFDAVINNAVFEQNNQGEGIIRVTFVVNTPEGQGVLYSNFPLTATNQFAYLTCDLAVITGNTTKDGLVMFNSEKKQITTRNGQSIELEVFPTFEGHSLKINVVKSNKVNSKGFPYMNVYNLFASNGLSAIEITKGESQAYKINTIKNNPTSPMLQAREDSAQSYNYQQGQNQGQGYGYQAPNAQTNQGYNPYQNQGQNQGYAQQGQNVPYGAMPNNENPF